MFFAGGGAEMRNAAFLRVTEENGQRVMREYGGERAVCYVGIRRRTGDALCGNMKESGQCGMREYGRAAAVRR